jgi:hypothetical protein
MSPEVPLDPFHHIVGSPAVRTLVIPILHEGDLCLWASLDVILLRNLHL